MGSRALGLGLWLGLMLPAPSASAEPRHSTMPGVAEVAHVLVELTARRWGGPRVPWPEPVDRPDGPLRSLRSPFRPLSVHAGEQVPEARLEAALEALEMAYDAMVAAGFEAPHPDAGRGGTAGFDLYLSDVIEGALGASDLPLPWSYLDAVSSFGMVEARAPGDRLAACVTAAYAEALLLAQDPAENAEVRRGAAAFFAFQVTGRFGCGDGVEQQQREPHRGWYEGSAGEGEGGALLWALLSARHDGGNGAFVRELWQVARQRTWEGVDLRASPDVPTVLDRMVTLAGVPLRATMVEVAVARGLLRPRASGHGAENRRYGVEAASPFWTVRLDATPARSGHSSPAPHPIEVFGSAYARIDVRDAPPGSRLHVWLRGEHGADWSLVCVPVVEGGDARARVVAPPGPDPRRSYAPVELAPGDHEVWVVVTNLGSASPEDAGAALDRRFELVVELSES